MSHGIKPRPSPTERFLTKVDMTANCWTWTASTNPDGYGQFYVGQAKFLAHRWLYERCVGPIPAGTELDHRCRNRACVRPSHLDPVSHRENVLRGVSPTALHAAKTRCVSGHPFDEENTRVTAQGARRCRTCHREASREHMQQRRAAARERPQLARTVDAEEWQL
ncbi:HNH endonuclease signature motif containing protein [Streptomyces sp. NPDC055006]